MIISIIICLKLKSLIDKGTATTIVPDSKHTWTWRMFYYICLFVSDIPHPLHESSCSLESVRASSALVWLCTLPKFDGAKTMALLNFVRIEMKKMFDLVLKLWIYGIVMETIPKILALPRFGRLAN